MTRFRSCFVSGLLGIVVLMVGVDLQAFVSIKVEYKDQFYPVIDVRSGMRPVIEVDGKRRSLRGSKYQFRQTGGVTFEGGYFEMKDRVLQTQWLESLETGAEFNYDLYFRAKVRASVDMENCFILIAIAPERHKSGVLLHQVRDLKAGKWTTVQFRVPTPVLISGGQAWEYLFTNGEEVLPHAHFAGYKRQLAQREAAKRFRPDSPPGVISQYNPGFPDALIGIVEEGSVRLEFTIGKSGQAHSIKVLEFTHELLVPAAIEAIEKTRFRAAVKNGEDVPTRLRQVINFTAPETGEPLARSE